MELVIGIDIGQKRDPTAIAVTEREDRLDGDRHRTHYLVRFLQRLPLGMPYPKVYDRISEIARGVRAKTGHLPNLFIDATGVGLPVVDALAEDQADIGNVTAVFFTHGDKVTERENARYDDLLLGKAFLVSQLQVLLQQRRIHLPRTSEAKVLAQELLDYEIRITEDANERYGAFRVGTHDDLVTALGLTLDLSCGPRCLWV